MAELAKGRILAGREVVGTYRKAHTKLHSRPWHKDVPEEHTPLLIKLVNTLDKLGFASAQTDFEPKKTEILAKFWEASDLLNIQELGFIDREDFDTNATDADRQALREMWH